MNRQGLSMLTSTHELADGMEKQILLSTKPMCKSIAMQPSQTWPKNNFSVSIQRISPFSSVQIQLDLRRLTYLTQMGHFSLMRFLRGF